MALESGMRRVRMVGAEHWTETPERELPTIAAGGDTYAVHERICIDSARVRLVLAEGEDVAAALREVYGEAVRDVRVFRLVEGGGEVVEGLPEWRLTLPLTDDAAHDPLPGMITRLAGVVVAAEPAVEEPVAVESVVEEAALPEVPALEEPVLLEAPADAVPVLEPADAVPTLEPAPEPAPFVLPEGLVMPELETPDAAVEEVAALELPTEPEPLADAELLAAAAAAAAAVAADPAAHEDSVAREEPASLDEPAADDPFAMPAETVFPTEAAEAEAPEAVATDEPADEPVEEPAALVEQPEQEPTEEVVAEEAVTAEVEAVDVVAEEPVAEVVPEPEPEPEPDPRDLAFAAVAAVLEVGRPTCAAVDRDGPCSVPSDVVWQTPAGAAWACAWHWPSAMAGYPGAEVGAVHAADAWTTWRDGSSIDLARQGADLFADAARGHEHPVARPLVALDRLDEMLKSLPDDLRGAILLWSISVTNPDWDVPAVAEHGRATHELIVADGRAVAFPDEIYFQQQVAAAPISPLAAEGEAPAVTSNASAEALFSRGTALASAGDLRGAAQAWTEAAEDHNHALSMRALGDLSSDRDDLKTAEEWYGRAAMLNDTTSMTRIALLLESRGQSERAAEWLRRAARFGDEEAARRLQHQGVVAASA